MSKFEEIKNDVTGRIDGFRVDVNDRIDGFKDDVNSRVDGFKNDVGTRSKSLLETVADIMESVNKPTLAFAGDIAGFTVAQLRLPTQANDMADYRSRSKDAVSAFGGTAKGHGQDLIAVLREAPGQIKGAFTVEEKAPVKKAPAKKTAAKKAPAKKAAAKA